MSTNNMPNAGDIVDHYRLLKPLAVGGTGILFKAHEVMLDRTVAIKFLSPQLAADEEYVQEFFHEARALAKLNHPNIIQVYTVGQHNGIPYFAMEFVEGEDLHLIVQTRGPLPSTEALQLVRQAAAGLQHAHKHGLIHRDIKPANLMLTSSGTIKLTDFGLAKNIQLSRTATDVFAGTPEFTSPEEARRQPVDRRTDIYSLGATLYYLLAGRPPFMGVSPEEILQQHIERTLPPIRQFQPNIPLAVNQVLEKAMAKQPIHRYQNCEAFIRALDQLITGKLIPSLSTSTPKATSPTPASPTPSHKSIVTSFVLTAIMLILTIILWRYVRNYLDNQSKAPPQTIRVVQGTNGTAQTNSIPSGGNTATPSLEDLAHAAFVPLKKTATAHLIASNYIEALTVYEEWPDAKFAGTKAGEAVIAERDRITKLAHEAWSNYKATAADLRQKNRPLEALALYEKAVRTIPTSPEIATEAEQLISTTTAEYNALQKQEAKVRELLTATAPLLLQLEFEKAQQQFQEVWDTQPANQRNTIAAGKDEVDRLAALKKAVIQRIPQHTCNITTWKLLNGSNVEGNLTKASADGLTVSAKVGAYGVAETTFRWNELQPASAIQLFTAYIAPTNSDELLAVGILLSRYATQNLVPAENARNILNSIATLDPSKKPMVNSYLKRLDDIPNP